MQYRIEKGLTASQLAKQLNIDTRTITRIETGKTARKYIINRYDNLLNQIET